MVGAEPIGVGRGKYEPFRLLLTQDQSTAPRASTSARCASARAHTCPAQNRVPLWSSDRPLSCSVPCLTPSDTSSALDATFASGFCLGINSSVDTRWGMRLENTRDKDVLFIAPAFDRYSAAAATIPGSTSTTYRAGALLASPLPATPSQAGARLRIRGLALERSRNRSARARSLSAPRWSDYTRNLGGPTNAAS